MASSSRVVRPEKFCLQCRSKKLRTSAQKNDVLLIEMGCNTAGVSSALKSSGVGIATRFNTVDAANRLAKALEGSSTLSEFFNRLASEDLQVVVESKTIKSRVQYHANFFETKALGRTQTKVGEVTVTTRATGAFSNWIPQWLRK